MTSPKMIEPLMRKGEFCARYGIAPKTAAEWAAKGLGPRAIKLGPKMTVYKVADVLAFDRATGLTA